MLIHGHTVRVIAGMVVVYGDDGHELGYFVRSENQTTGDVEYRTARGSFATPGDAVLDVITAPSIEGSK